MVALFWEKIGNVEWDVEQEKCSGWVWSIKNTLKTLNICSLDTMIDRDLSSECPIREIGTISKMQKYIDTNNESYKDSDRKSYSSAPKKYIHKTSV